MKTTNEAPFSFYRFGRNSYSVLERASGLEIAVVRGKREGRALRDALLASGARDFDGLVAAARAAVRDLGLATVRRIPTEDLLEPVYVAAARVGYAEELGASDLDALRWAARSALDALRWAARSALDAANTAGVPAREIRETYVAALDGGAAAARNDSEAARRRELAAIARAVR